MLAMHSCRESQQDRMNWTAFNQYDLLSVLVQDQDQTLNAVTVTAELDTAVVQLQLELLCIKTASVFIVMYLVTG